MLLPQARTDQGAMTMKSTLLSPKAQLLKPRRQIVCVISRTQGGCPCGVMVKAMDCGIVVSEFELQLRYYVHFRANTLGKSMNPLILLAMG